MIKKRSLPYSISDGGFCSEAVARDMVACAAGCARVNLQGSGLQPRVIDNLRAGPSSGLRLGRTVQWHARQARYPVRGAHLKGGGADQRVYPRSSAHPRKGAKTYGQSFSDQAIIMIYNTYNRTQTGR